MFKKSMQKSFYNVFFKKRKIPKLNYLMGLRNKSFTYAHDKLQPVLKRFYLYQYSNHHFCLLYILQMCVRFQYLRNFHVHRSRGALARMSLRTQDFQYLSKTIGVLFDVCFCLNGPQILDPVVGRPLVGFSLKPKGLACL